MVTAASRFLHNVTSCWFLGGGVICSSFRSRGGVGGCFARVCEADGAWSNIFPLLDSANVHFSLRQSPNAPTLVYIYTHISLCGFFMYRLCTFAQCYCDLHSG